ncbi:MAG: leucyl aminopeptidase [Verrucomicrobia bacterium]|nr:leucyl aminopeptidase [Verrucomicrobiota bacterium]
MDSIEFVTATEKKGVVITPLRQEKSSPLFEELLRCKPASQILEIMTSSGRVLGVKIEQETRQAREEAGALLFKKIIEGIEETIIIEEELDLLTGMMLASWSFDKYVTPTKPKRRFHVVVVSKDPRTLEKEFERTRAEIEGVLYARALTSEPPNIFYPTAYAERLKELTDLGIEVEILSEEGLRSLGMRALLAAGQGSVHPSAVAILSWNGAQKETKPIALVGKGVCFDSGGLCLKPKAHQTEMKWDKAGAGVVAGVMKALALAKAPVHVVGVLGLVENMPDGAAIKPGDIIKAMSGKTIEIVDTDAEGRLVLADCLWYALTRFQPSAMIDLGTLTMETFATLGHAYAGLYSNSPQLKNELLEAGNESRDLLWELPMGPFFAKQIESSVADMKNAGVEFLGENGAAAEFLKQFCGDVPWAHIDIAGVSWTKEDLPLAPKGVTGFGVRLLYRWLTNDKRQ